MITEADINQAIAECQAERDPNGWTAIRLAAFLTIRQQMFGNPDTWANSAMLLPIRGASYASGPQSPAEEIVEYTSKTAFGKAIDGKRAATIWPIMDELMSILQKLYPDLYNVVLQRVNK